MSNVLEGGNSQGNGRAPVDQLRLMRRAYRRGFFTEATTVPLPEIVADGRGPDDWLHGSRESACSPDGSYRRGSAFSVAADLQGQPFCARCGVLHSSSGAPCPVCENT